MATDPFSGLGNDAWTQLFTGVPTIDQALAADASTGTATMATSSVQPSTQQLLAQIPAWVWAVLGVSLVIVLMGSRR
jgi:hypothetical protein